MRSNLGDGASVVCDGLAVTRVAPSGDGITHAHPFHLLLVALEGSGTLEFTPEGGAAVRACPGCGEAIVWPAALAGTVRAAGPVTCMTVQIAPGLTDLAADRLRLTGLPPLRPGGRPDPVAGRIAGLLADLAADPGAGRDAMADSLGAALAVHLVREYAGPGDRPGAGALGPEALGRVEEYVRRNLDGDLSLTRLAREAGLSPYHFARVFRAATGRSPKQFVLARRVEHARGLIAAGGGIADAALAAGFSSQSHLTLHFRRLLGRTPGASARRPG